ncbi:hypothetical protein FACS1894122_15560 [Alphaproteobacteria bacterium]|nr:hypothetical protein FACS1894122_15560 [Alphaproteobacteria bacterium]
MNRKVHVRFWSRVGRGNLSGLGNYHEFIPFDAETAQKYSDRAVQIIKATESNELLPRLSNDSSFFKCKMCGFKNVCWGDAQ